MCDPQFRTVLAKHRFTLDEGGEINEFAPYAGAFTARSAQVARNLARYEAEWRRDRAGGRRKPTVVGAPSCRRGRAQRQTLAPCRARSTRPGGGRGSRRCREDHPAARPAASSRSYRELDDRGDPNPEGRPGRSGRGRVQRVLRSVAGPPVRLPLGRRRRFNGTGRLYTLSPNSAGSCAPQDPTRGRAEAVADRARIRYLTLAEAAERMSVSVKTLRRRIADGTCPPTAADAASPASVLTTSTESSSVSPRRRCDEPRHLVSDA